MRAALSITVAAALGGCATEMQPEPGPPITYLSPTEHLTRASLALRGVRPSLDDLRTVAADPTALPGIVDRYLASPELGETIRDLHNEVWLLRIQSDAFLLPPAGPLAGHSGNEMMASVFDEPLRLIEDIVMTDQPYTAIVTADYTMADPIVAAAWGMDHSSAPGWERTHHTAPADHAGILSIPALFVRYRNSGINENRARANAIAKGLLCHDFLDSQIRIDGKVDLSRPDVVRDQVVSNSACAACHQALDPLASYFYGYAYGPLTSVTYPFTNWNVDPNPTWLFHNNRPPMYFGQDADGLEGLGQAIAADPRFARCAAMHFASYLTERDVHELDAGWIAELQKGFVADHFNARHLARAIVLSDQFRAAASDDDAAAEDVRGYQKLRPEQLRRMLAALTGFVWSADNPQKMGGQYPAGHTSLLDDDQIGYRVLAGGIDSFTIVQPVHTLTATSALVIQRAAEQAAIAVVAHDAAAPPADRRLFSEADVGATDEASVRRELVALHGRIYGELLASDDERIDQTYRLFTGALAIDGDPRRAWTVTLTGMLSDVRAVYY